MQNKVKYALKLKEALINFKMFNNLLKEKYGEN